MKIIERAVEIAASQDEEGESSVKAQAAPPPVELVTTTPARVLRRADPAPPAAPVKAPETIVRIDQRRLRELGRLPAEEHERRTENEIRRIKWPLLGAINGRAGQEPARNNVIVVTSAMPGEGKTFITLNLALSIVRDRELNVVLVDADVARPGLTPALGLDERPGLNDVLDDVHADIGAVTYATDVPGLFVVPAGKSHERAAEFFAGSRMSVIIDDLIRRIGKGVVLLDSPPLLATNEAQVVTRAAGQVLLVVRADGTPQRAVREAIALIDESAVVSAVLNDVRPWVLGSYLGHYEYGFDAGYGQGRHAARDRPGPARSVE